MNDFNAYRNPRLAEAIRRVYGEELDVGTFAPEINAAIILELDRYENRLMQGLRYWTTGDLVVTAAPANNSRLQIHNPAGSQLIVVVTGFLVFNPAAVAAYLVTLDGALAGSPTANLALDTRVPLSAATRKVASLNRFDNALPGISGTHLYRRTSVIGQDVVFNFEDASGGPEMPITLTPNTVCELVNGTVNAPLNALGFGYERPARPEELVPA